MTTIIQKEFTPRKDNKNLHTQLCKCYHPDFYKYNYLFPGTRYVCCYCYDISKYDDIPSFTQNVRNVLCCPFLCMFDSISLPYRCYKIFKRHESNVSIDNESIAASEVVEYISSIINNIPPPYLE
jgi:hypothetical protein